MDYRPEEMATLVPLVSMMATLGTSELLMVRMVLVELLLVVLYFLVSHNLEHGI